MKKVIAIALILVAAVCCFNAFNNQQSVTKAEFNATHERLKKQIDSILQNCDSLKTELRAVRANTDSIKAAQDVIFHTMHENSAEKRSLFDLIMGR
jgi:phage shock protein A